MSRKRLGMTAVVDAEDRLLGLFTDGDLRRALDDGHDRPAHDPGDIADDAFAEDHRRRRSWRSKPRT